MAEVELVIKVSEEVYNRFGHEYSEENLISKYTNDAILEAFCNGTPLPKGHGRLIDADALEYDKGSVATDSDIEYYVIGKEDIDRADTIIEADMEQKSMTYGDIYNEFCKKFPNAKVEDYRPAVEMHIPQLSKGIPNAIIVWFKDGSKVIYIAESER